MQTRIDTYAWAKAELRPHLQRSVYVFEALAEIEDNAISLVETTLATIQKCIQGLIEPSYQRAVESRTSLISQWPWPLERAGGGAFLHLLLALYPPEDADEPLAAKWPSFHTTSATVAQWADAWLQANANPAVTKELLQRMHQTARNRPIAFRVRQGLPFRRLTTPALALLYECDHEIKQNQQKKFIALDTSKTHTKLLEACRDLPKTYGVAEGWVGLRNDRILELILPNDEAKRNFQLSLDLGAQGLTEQIAGVIRKWRCWEGLRHWVTFLSLLTSNRRLGWVRWTVDDHLRAQNLSDARRRRSDIRQSAATLVKLFTEIQLAVFDTKGKIYHQRPLILVGGTFSRLVGSELELEGLELQINPLLYRGVRDHETGKLGNNWWPTPYELPYIDHHKFGPAIALGLILPGRWYMELRNTGKPYIDLRGDSLLHAAGLAYSPSRSFAAWRTLERNLVELQRRSGLGSWEWRGQPDLGTLCRLRPPPWVLDRITHGVPPTEASPHPSALTGSELKEWRKAKKLTQAEAAKLLDVNVSTIKRAELKGEKALSRKLRDSLARQ